MVKIMMTSLNVRSTDEPNSSQITLTRLFKLPTIGWRKPAVCCFKGWAARAARRKLTVVYNAGISYSGRSFDTRCRLETILINMIKTIEPQIDALSLTCDVTRSHQPTWLWRHQVVIISFTITWCLRGGRTLNRTWTLNKTCNCCCCCCCCCCWVIESYARVLHSTWCCDVTTSSSRCCCCGCGSYNTT